MDVDFELFSDRKKFEHDARNQIRKHSLDPYNRLHSIAEDIEFVQDVHEKYYSSYPLLANLRCGTWYCDSRKAGGITSHFKSSDGHYNGWSFNLRRPNLHILAHIQAAGGICIVDSTRSGKRMPDSLSKTVPIWCTVINRVLKFRGLANSGGWDIQLYTPPQSVSKQEHAQIESKLLSWVEALATSSYNLPQLDRSLRPIWVTPASTVFPSFDKNTNFLPVICISASRSLEEGTERRRQGYSYVQGAGDDHENWSDGLIPDVFWRCKDELLNATEADFPDVLKCIVGEARSTIHASDWAKLPTPIARVKGLLSIAAMKDLPDSVFDTRIAEEMPVPCIVIRGYPEASASIPVQHVNPTPIYDLVLQGDKKAMERAFKSSLPQCLRFIGQYIGEGRRVCIACETGKDLSVGIALAALQAFFDDNGQLNLERYDSKELKVTKESLRTRLHWIISSRPEANPSRATLKKINEFFMSPLRSGST
ncbi:initiator tRNA phosphoribosyl transferase [Sanghuangporus baumii]|uniref:Initiator tRNA phosphoribosyl transferase n=1 Tax=Sanghuangporus baumii TaxID=108892 RepID=A0A9Q5I4I7_SANBA|nr:initiator tRNA phosphoribosyl transferase [Sanghuangporus baumii]